jgi:hypothetical protein
MPLSAIISRSPVTSRSPFSGHGTGIRSSGHRRDTPSTAPRLPGADAIERAAVLGNIKIFLPFPVGQK